MPALDSGRSLALLLDELKRLKREGVESVYLSDAGLAWLRQLGENRVSKGVVASGKPAARPLGKPQESVNLIDLVQEPPSSTTKRKKSATQPAADPAVILPPPPRIELPAGDKHEQWTWLQERVLQCETCRNQVKPGKQVVFGVGNLDADIFFCGEAPGADEEVQGEPFVGPAGQLLTRIIQAMGLSREAVYIGNIMNWRPETGTGYGNRPPSREEMAFCMPYLLGQLEIVKPKAVVALGATAAKGLQSLDSNPRMGDVRGRWYEVSGIPLMITFHPSYLLRNQTKAKKRLVWEDMLLVMEKLGMPISDKQRGYFL